MDTLHLTEGEYYALTPKEMYDYIERVVDVLFDNDIIIEMPTNAPLDETFKLDRTKTDLRLWHNKNIVVTFKIAMFTDETRKNIVNSMLILIGWGDCVQIEWDAGIEYLHEEN